MRGWMILLAALISVASAAAAAPAITASRWETYTNTRYGVIIDYPADVFAIEPPPPDNAGRNFEAPSLKARFFVYTTANALDQSLAELEAEDIADLEDKDATNQNGADWYQVVGKKNDEVIARRVVLSEGGAMVHRLEIGFPADAAGAFAPIIERMMKGFRVDPTIPEKAAERAGQAAPAPAAPAGTPSTPRAAPQKQAGPAQPEPISGEGWRVQMPSRDYKDLPALISHRDITHGAELGNITFVCDRSRYYVLLVSPFFKYRLTQEGRVTLDDAANTRARFAISMDRAIRSARRSTGTPISSTRKSRRRCSPGSPTPQRCASTWRSAPGRST